jgi:hypothetical protein
MKFDAHINSLDGTSKSRSFNVARMYNFGSATRDPNTATAHQQEVAKSGIYIALDVPAPRIYPIAPHALTSEDTLGVQCDQTSGEVEIVMVVSDQLYVGVGSDHTDRAIETQSILASKQACANHLAPTLWPYNEIRDHWDDCVMRSWVDGRLYQDVSVSAFLEPEAMIALLRERVSNVPEKDIVVYSGTIVSVDKKLGFGHQWRYQMEDPISKRTIDAQYNVTNLLDEVKEPYRVPLFNPQPDKA